MSNSNENDQEVIERFGMALRQAMVANGMSERRMAAALGITIGTTQKYFRGVVHPMKVATGINQKLAALLGITLDALLCFYETGKYENPVSFPEVVGWVRSQAGIEHLTPILEAMSQASRRLEPGSSALEQTLPRYNWPMQELTAAGVSAALRERMGLTEEVMERLAVDGKYDEELVEAFSVATGLQEEDVRRAFEARKPVDEV